MKRLAGLMLHVVCAAIATAQDGDSLRLSPSLRHELEGVFALPPVAAPMPRQDGLTVEQLHEWVGAPTADTIALQTSPSRYTREYFLYKCWLKDFEQLALLPTAIKIPGLNETLRDASGNTGGIGIDANHAVSMLFSRRYRTVVRAQRLADSHRTAIETAVPLGDSDSPRTTDKLGERTTLVELPWWAQWMRKK